MELVSAGQVSKSFQIPFEEVRKWHAQGEVRGIIVKETLYFFKEAVRERIKQQNPGLCEEDLNWFMSAMLPGPVNPNAGSGTVLQFPIR